MENRENFSSAIFAKRVLIAIGIVVPLLLIIWFLGAIFELLLLLVAAILVHAFFLSFAQFIRHFTKLPMGWSKLASVVIILGVIFLANWFIAPQIVAQIKQLIAQLPQSLEATRDYLQEYWWGSFLLAQIPGNIEQYLETHNYFMGFFTTTFGILANVYIVVLLAAYFLVNPRPYANGLVLLFPKTKRKRIRTAIHKVYRTLQLWLEGKLISMLFVAILTTVGLYILGLPLALALGLIAGLLGFIPNFGPIIAAIPAILIAFSFGWDMVLYVIALYFGVQALESNILAPIVQRHMIYLPFAMILLAQVAFGLLTGLLGLILATPIVAAIIAAVKMLYVHDVLGDEEATVGY